MQGAAIGAASGGAFRTGVNAITRGNEIIVRPEQLLQFRMNQAALVPVTLKDGHQVPPGSAAVKVTAWWPLNGRAAGLSGRLFFG